MCQKVEPNSSYYRLMWIRQRPDWPNFTHDMDRFSAILTDYRHRAEKLAGDVTRLALDDQQEAMVDLLICGAIKTSAIQGEQLQWIKSFSDHAMLFVQLET